MDSELRATYRLQFSSSFTFADGAAVADYLSALGVSHVYCSPYLQAAEGSTHGYDVVDPTRVNRELGGDAGHEQFCDALRGNKLGQILDIVPNHMAIDAKQNAWWWSVLENGQSSPYAAFFDVDWDPPESRLRNRVMMPILGAQYGRVLEAHEIELRHHTGTFTIHYFDHVLPISPRSQALVLHPAALQCKNDELLFVAEHLRELPRGASEDRDTIERRRRDTAFLNDHFERLCREHPDVANAIDAEVADINEDIERLHELLEQQNYRLAYWKTVQQDLGYRRFFDINSLAALNIDDARVFELTHGLVVRWLHDGTLRGVRVDHPDGLRDPEGYFRRLRETAPRAYVIAEKILEHGEHLPRSWPIDGTTGYDFLNRALGVLVDPSGAEPLERLYVELTGEQVNWPEFIRARKLQVMDDVLGGDLNRLAELFLKVCESERRYRDATRQQATEVLREVAACMPIYRTYVRANIGMVTEEDEACIRKTVKRAWQHRPDLDADLFKLFRNVLLLRTTAPLAHELVMRFQQFTGPVMAKGVEDTALYCYHRLTALNEVGGDPSCFGLSVEDFHAACGRVQRTFPATMLSTSTHDTKRSEDVRARLALLAEIPDAWAAAVRVWRSLLADVRPASVDANTEYLIYQTLVGAWPIERERVADYIEKAVREAKVNTSWTEPNAAYEADLNAFIGAAFSHTEFIEQLEAFVERLRTPGYINSLAQTLLKLTAPGVPDIYQGCELWNFSLVDPDNRRPVDFEQSRRLLVELNDLSARQVWERRASGLPKMWLVHRGLRVRAAEPEAFGPAGHYKPLFAAGAEADHVLAFARGDTVIPVAQRLPMKRSAWTDTTLPLPEGTWRNVLDNDREFEATASLAELLAEFPVALLRRGDESPTQI